MGFAKVIFVTGLYVITGLYSFGFKSAERTFADVANSSAVLALAEEMARSGLAVATREAMELRPPYVYPVLPNRTLTLSSVQVTYRADNAGLPIHPGSLTVGDQTRITVTATIGNTTVTKIAIIELKGWQWWPVLGGQSMYLKYSVARSYLTSRRTTP